MSCPWFTMNFIPFNKPTRVGNELQYITDAVEQGHLSGDGMYTRKCHALLEEVLRVPKVLLTTSCTHALEIAALLLDVHPGDEVIVPSFTFVSTVNPFVLRGARPVFVDIRPDTLNLDETLLEQAISDRTKAIIPVHYAGVGCEMDAIGMIAARYQLAVIEDNAHGLFATYKGRYLGTFGMMAAQSFHDTKNFTCGEGGALIINDPELIERAEIIREKGTNRSRFFRGQVDKYTWVSPGSSYLPADILAAFLYAQLEAREQIQTTRNRLWNYYLEHLHEWAEQHGIRLPIVPPYCEQTYHIFYLLLPSLDERQRMVAHLKTHGIQSAFHYLPLHLSGMGQQFGTRPGQYPVTERVSDRLLRLPLYTTLTQTNQDAVIAAVRKFY